MYLWVHGQWERIDGVLLESEQHVGTVKVFDSYSWGDDHVPDISVVKTPQFWDMNIDQERMVKVDVKKNKICTNTTKKNVLQTGTVQKGNIRTSSGQVQIISSKRVVKLMKQGEPMFLAMIRPTGQTKQGVTQKVKQQMMKETGPVRKTPPVGETRKRMCPGRTGRRTDRVTHIIEGL